MTPLEKIKAKCIECNPEIQSWMYGVEPCNKHKDFVFIRGKIECGECKPGCRPIRLADVLLTFKMSKCLDEYSICDVTCELVWEKQWNLLADNLMSQDTKTLEYIAEVLCL